MVDALQYHSPPQQSQPQQPQPADPLEFFRMLLQVARAQDAARCGLTDELAADFTCEYMHRVRQKWWAGTVGVSFLDGSVCLAWQGR